MSRAAALIAVALLASTGGCKKKAGMSVEDVIGVFEGFRTDMCGCHDKACADLVQDRMNRWSAEAAKQAPGDRSTDAQTKRMQDIGAAYADCMAKALGVGDNAAAVPEPPVQTTMSDATVTNADVLIKQLYDGLSKDQVVTQLSLSYIHADGTIDAKYGHVEADLGKPKRPAPADDPDRPIGAPVPADEHMADDVMARCPTYRWEGGKRTPGETTCFAALGEPLARPRCSVLAVWKQAIAAGAPAAGLALIALRSDGWEFTIDDEPRNIHFQQTFPDTCAPMLEKP